MHFPDLTRTKLAARLKIQAKMTKVPFPPEFEVLSQLVGTRGCPWCKICRKTYWRFFSALGEPVARCVAFIPGCPEFWHDV